MWLSHVLQLQLRSWLNLCSQSQVYMTDITPLLSQMRLKPKPCDWTNTFRLSSRFATAPVIHTWRTSRKICSSGWYIGRPTGLHINLYHLCKQLRWTATYCLLFTVRISKVICKDGPQVWSTTLWVQLQLYAIHLPERHYITPSIPPVAL